MSKSEQDLILDLLKEIKEDTKELPVLESKVEELLQMKRDLPNIIISTVNNNSKFNTKIQQTSRETIVNYLNTDEARENLEKRVNEILKKRDLRQLLSYLAVFGTVLTIVFTAYINWWFGE